MNRTRCEEPERTEKKPKMQGGPVTFCLMEPCVNETQNELDSDTDMAKTRDREFGLEFVAQMAKDAPAEIQIVHVERKQVDGTPKRLQKKEFPR